MRAGVQELAQALSPKRDRIGPRDSDKVKTLRVGESGERGLEGRRT
jgi:hypothetical protein